MNDQTSHLATEQEPPPNWATLDREILCPLCDYNLRGLVEPRCPECGHRSTWAELLDATTQKHPWLFEHADRRRIASLVLTFFKSQFPRTFWKVVHPTHRPRAGRLIIYWSIVSCLLMLELGTPFLTQVGKYYLEIHQRRQDYSHFLQTGPTTRPGRRVVAPMVPSAADARAAATFPYEISWNVLTDVETQMPYRYRIAGHLCFVLLLWPLVTFVSLMIFRQTLRQARIRNVHVLRCAVYMMDSAVLLAWPFALAMAWCVDPLTNTGRGNVFFTPHVFVALLAITGLFTYRLSCAYQYYMRFPAPVCTCVASQVIVVLAVLAIMPWVIMF